MRRALRTVLIAGLAAGSAACLPSGPASAQTDAPAGAPGTAPDAGAVDLAAPGGGALDPETQALIEEAERTRPVPTELLNDLAMGRGNTEKLINEFLASGNATPREVAVRAIALSLAVGRDPRLKDSDRRFTLNQTINDGMSKSLGAPRILNVEVEADFVPQEGSFAWDLGGLETPIADGFQQLTPFSAEVGGLGMRDQDRVGDGPALQDVIENLQSVNLQVPNGQYRVVLLTAAQMAARSDNPFGESFKVNGVEYFLGKSGVGDWFDTAYLRGAGDAVIDNVSYGAAGLSVIVEVGNGTLNLEFAGGAGALGSILSGIIMEPVELPSRFDTSAVTGPRRATTTAQGQQGNQPARAAVQQSLPSASLDAVVALEFQTQAAIAAVSGISPAAGPGPGTTPQPPAPAPVPPPRVPPPRPVSSS